MEQKGANGQTGSGETAPGFVENQGAASSSSDSRSPSLSVYPELPMFASMVNDLMTEDCLLVLSRGLGVHSLLLHFLRRLSSSNPCQLVFILNLPPEEALILSERVELLQEAEKKVRAGKGNGSGAGGVLGVRFKTVTAEVSQQDRHALFASGGVFAVTSRILVTDLLSGKVPPEMVTGMVVMHAHKLADRDNEAFILQVFRKKNKAGFIKGISDRPEFLVRGFSGVERVMKHLQVQRLHLYPRFHLSVLSSLQTSQPTAAERVLQLPPLVTDCQKALLGMLDKGLVEVRKEKGVDLSGISVEDSLFKAFEHGLKEKCGPVWHKIAPSTRRTVEDLGVIRKLLSLLLRADCVAFHSHLESLRASQEIQADWFLTAEADVLFRRAKARVLAFETEGVGTGRNAPSVRPVLEPNVKWRHLRDVILMRGAGEDTSSAEEGKREKRKRAEREVVEVEVEESVEGDREDERKGAGESANSSSASAAGVTGEAEERRKESRGAKRSRGVDSDSSSSSSSAAAAASSSSSCTAAAPPAAAAAACSGKGAATFDFVIVDSSDEEEGGGLRGGGGVRKGKEMLGVKANGTSSSSSSCSSSSSLPLGLGKFQKKKRERGVVRILVVVGEESTSRQLRQVLAEGESHVLLSSLSTFLSSHRERERRNVALGRSSRREQHQQRGGGGRGRGPPPGAPLSSQQQQPQQAQRVQAPMASPISAEAAREARLLDALLERLRQRPGGRAGMAVDPSAPELNAVLTGLVQTEREKRKNTQSGQDQGGSPLECGTEGVEVKFVACNALPCGALDFELRRFCPHSVVLYDPELAAVRECESYCAEVFAAVRGLEALSSRKRDQPEGAEGGQVASVGVGGSGGAGWIRSDLAVGSELCVDILVYAESAEQHRFRTSVEKEKDAWESLIRQKKHLLVPVSELSTASDDAILRLIESSGTAAQNLGPLWSSRKAGGGRARALQIASLTLKPSVIVDMREFSAGLPAALFGAGLTLTPVTITVGDYILSRDICIERKSVPDLVQSFHSGRLFHQCVRMKRHYATPCLLIDFSRHKGFALPSSGSAGGSSQQAAIDPLALTSKICLLALQFPELRLVWSPSVAFAARLFSLLKVGREQPDLQRAMSAGTEEDDESPTASGTGGSGSSASSSSSSASASAAFASAFSSSSSSSSSASASGTGGGPLAEAADGLDVSSSVSNAVDLRGSAGGSADAAQKPKDSTETSAQRGRGRGGRDGTASSQSPSSSEVVVEGIGGQGERDGEMAPESSASASASSSSGGEGGAGRVGQKEKGGGKSPVPTVFVIDDDDDDDVVDLYVGDGNGQASADGEAERKERFEKAGAGQSERVERKDASVEEESSGSAENSSRRVSTSSKKREGPLQEEEEATLPEVDAKKQIATAAKTDDQPENPRAASPSPASSSSASSPQESGTNKGQSQPSQGAAPETADRAASSASSPAPAAEPAGAPSGQASLQHQAVTADSASNHVAVDVLRKLPGVTPRNASIIVRKVESLAALCLLSEQEMITMIGPTCGRELFAFINKDGMQL